MRTWQRSSRTWDSSARRRWPDHPAARLRHPAGEIMLPGSKKRSCQGHTRLGLVVQVTVAMLRDLGVEMDAILSRVGLDPDTLRPDGRVSVELIHQIWDEAVRVSGDSLLGVRLGERIHIEQLGMVGYCIKTSDTLGEVVRRTERYSAVLGDDWQWELQERGDTVTLRLLEVAGAQRHPQVAMALLAAMGNIGPRVLNRSLEARAIRFRHAAPGAEVLKSLQERYGPISFGASEDSIDFDRGYLDLRVPDRDPILCALLEKQVEQMLAELPGDDGVLYDVSQVIAQALHAGHVDSDLVASRLSMSPRTLRRQLHKSGTTFQRLVDEVRFTLSRRFLRSTDMDVSEIAWELGYNNASAFGRAFRRWSGMSALEFRSRGGAPRTSSRG